MHERILLGDMQRKLNKHLDTILQSCELLEKYVLLCVEIPFMNVLNSNLDKTKCSVFT